MSLNPPLDKNHFPVPIKEEQFVVERKGIEFAVEIANFQQQHVPAKRLKGQGRLILSTARIVLINELESIEDLRSFEMPLVQIYQENLQKPVVGPNYFQGSVKIAKEGSFPSEPRFKIWFKEGGYSKFLPVLTYLLEKIRTAEKEKRPHFLEQEIKDPAFHDEFGRFDPNDPTLLYTSQSSILAQLKNNQKSENAGLQVRFADDQQEQDELQIQSEISQNVNQEDEGSALQQSTQNLSSLLHDTQTSAKCTQSEVTRGSVYERYKSKYDQEQQDVYQVGNFLIDQAHILGAGEFGIVYLAQEIPEDLNLSDEMELEGEEDYDMTPDRVQDISADPANGGIPAAHTSSEGQKVSEQDQIKPPTNQNEIEHEVQDLPYEIDDQESKNGTMPPKDYEFLACKVVEKSILTKKQQKQIENEIINQDEVVSRYVVKMRKAIETPDRVYIFMEYCNGGDLKQLLELKDWDIQHSTVHQIMRQVVEGYNASIQSLVVHRDIKPKNIMVHFVGQSTDLIDLNEDQKIEFLKNVDLTTEKWEMKIADFGLSKKVKSTEVEFLQYCGTLLFMSPQVLLREAYTYKADVWSMGVLLFYMLNKDTTPFYGQRTKELEADVIQGTYSMTIPCIDEITLECAMFICQALQDDERKRLSFGDLLKHPYIVKDFEAQNKIVGQGMTQPQRSSWIRNNGSQGQTRTDELNMYDILQNLRTKDAYQANKLEDHYNEHFENLNKMNAPQQMAKGLALPTAEGQALRQELKQSKKLNKFMIPDAKWEKLQARSQRIEQERSQRIQIEKSQRLEQQFLNLQQTQESPQQTVDQYHVKEDKLKSSAMQQSVFYDFHAKLKSTEAQPVVTLLETFIRKTFPKLKARNVPREKYGANVQYLTSDMTDKFNDIFPPSDPKSTKGYQELYFNSEGIEKIVMRNLYKKVFNHPHEYEFNKSFVSKIPNHQKYMKPVLLELISDQTHRLDPIRVEMIEHAGQQLQSLNNYQTPKAKLTMFINFCRILSNMLKETNMDIQPDGVDLFYPSCLYTILLIEDKQILQDLYTNVQFVKNFRHSDRLSGEDHIYLNILEASVEFLHNFPLRDLNSENQQYKLLVRKGLEKIEKQNRQLDEFATKELAILQDLSEEPYVKNYKPLKQVNEKPLVNVYNEMNNRNKAVKKELQKAKQENQKLKTIFAEAKVAMQQSKKHLKKFSQLTSSQFDDIHAISQKLIVQIEVMDIGSKDLKSKLTTPVYDLVETCQPDEVGIGEEYAESFLQRAHKNEKTKQNESTVILNKQSRNSIISVSSSNVETSMMESRLTNKNEEIMAIDSQRQDNVQDYSGCGQNKEIMDQLAKAKDQKVIFSCSVIKYNKWGVKRERILLLTNKALYSIKDNNLQRKINIKNIKGLTKHTVKDSNEFVVHIRKEYDYQFQSDLREQIFQAIKQVYWQVVGKNIPVYGRSDNLKKYLTSKKSISQGQEVKPNEKFRLRGEDLYVEKHQEISGAKQDKNPEIVDKQEKIVAKIETREKVEQIKEPEKVENTTQIERIESEVKVEAPQGIEEKIETVEQNEKIKEEVISEKNEDENDEDVPVIDDDETPVVQIVSEPQTSPSQHPNDVLNANEISRMNEEFENMHSTSIFVRDEDQESKAATLADFEIRKVLGRGSFGKVFLCVKKQTGNIYAMKALRKDVLIDCDSVHSTLLEKEILMKANHPFLVGMEFVFQTEDKIFFVMKFVRGGELFQHLRNFRQFPESYVQFFILNIAIGLGHLHENRIIYRDMKPENVLMGEDGYLQIIDFGFAKILEPNEMTKTSCGTPQYLAPEILRRESYAYSVDWWCLGILTYELMYGVPPFDSDGSGNPKKMYQRILREEPRYPKHFSELCKDFIKSCLIKDPKKRLGCTNGLPEIINHPWLAKLAAEALAKKTLKPPMKPKLSNNPFDIQNFDEVFTNEAAVQSVIPTEMQKLIKKKAHLFKQFDTI